MRFEKQLLVIVCILCSGIAVNAQDKLTTKSGTTTLDLQVDSLRAIGVAVDLVVPTDSIGGPTSPSFVTVAVKSGSFSVSNGKPVFPSAYFIPTVGRLVLSQHAHVLKLGDFIIRIESNGKGTLVLAAAKDTPLLSFTTDGLSYIKERNALVLSSSILSLAPAGAEALGITDKVGTAIGTIRFELSASKSSPQTSQPPNVGHTNGPDLTFCKIDSLTQFGREGDVVGLSFSTTSWNIGTIPLDWYRYPEWRHPFIARNFYRISDSRIEQIGEGGIKHGFYAASSDDCHGTCDGIQGTQLGVGCTDTYGAGTSADQKSLGPRYEINPWDGFYSPATSHLRVVPNQQHDPPHNTVTHLLRVHDADLNVQDSYILEGYYVHYQDMNPMNSAAWKPVKVIGLGSGGTWNFQMDDEAAPNIGFAIDAWRGAKETVIAESNPVVKGKSPDGRSILAAKPQKLQNGLWRYEYAILNVDMDRQIGSLEIPIPQGTTVTDITFHSPEHDGEVYNSVGGTKTDSAEWSKEGKLSSIAWKTTTNPLRWGTLYNFGFTADSGPADVNVVVGLFKPGSINSLSVSTLGPAKLQ
jgi:hypothetical protein